MLSVDCWERYVGHAILELTNKDGSTADFIEEAHSILHAVLGAANTKEEGKHEESKEEELREAHGQG